MRQDYDNGKYTVIFDRETGELRALRNGEAWQDLSGNKLVYWMLVEHKRALEQRAELLEALKEVQDYIRFGQDLRSADEVLSKAITKVE